MKKGRVVYQECSSRDTVLTPMSKPREPPAVVKNMKIEITSVEES